MRNLLIVLSGPSGVGKGTIVKELLKKGNCSLSVSCTTRPPRKGEVHGKDYFFISRGQFEEDIKSGGFLEYSEHFGNYYGTPRAFVEQKLKEGDVLLEIDVDGALQVKKSHPEALLIMIAPPNKQALRQRLILRGSEMESKIEERLARTDYELSLSDKYDYVVVNDILSDAVERVGEIINREKGVNI